MYYLQNRLKLFQILRLKRHLSLLINCNWLNEPLELIVKLFGYNIYIYQDMNQELLDAIKKRKKQLGGEEEPKQEEIKKPVEPTVKGQNFNKNKQMLENLFGKKNQPQPVVQKEEIKGDQKNFNNAKALLEQQFGKPNQNVNVLNINSGSGLSGLPLPPPPPSIGMPSLPLPPPPPPPLGILPPIGNLPPPPTLNIANLPPPPILNTPSNLPNNPPPKMPNLPPPVNQTSILNLPPPINLPPNKNIQNLPPPQNLQPPRNTQINLPPQMPNLLPPPPPPSNNLPPPNMNTFNQQPQRQQTINQPKQYITNQNQQSSSSNQRQPSYQNIQQQQIRHQPSYQQNNQQPPPIHNTSSNQMRPPTNIQNKGNEQEDACFILSQGESKPKNTSIIPQVTAWNKDQLQKSQKKRIFDKKSAKKYPLTEQFFGKNIGGLIKQQFLKSVDILGTIDKQVKKTMFNFNFPTIQNRFRNIEPVQTLYANTDNLDLVSCYMTKNLNAIKVHNQQRDKFMNGLKNYNWQADTLKYRPIRDSAANLPNSSFIEPNFAQLKNSFRRVDGVIKTLANQQQFEKCNQLKKIKNETQNMLSQYIADPKSNASLYQKIDNNIVKMKSIEA